MDVLSDILDTLRLRGSLYFTTEFQRPWGLRVPAYRRVARFHLVVRGTCWVKVGSDDAVELESGDLILIPHGAEHVLADTPDTPCRTVEEVVRAAGFSGRGALVISGEEGTGAARLVCGHFEFDEGQEHPLLAQLPSALVIRWNESSGDGALEDGFRQIAREARESHPGHEAVIRRLSEVLFVQAIRHWAGRAKTERGVLAALADARLGAALQAMHEAPAKRWTLELLGREAALGRSAFAARFRDVVGETPLQYLTRWRIQRASRLMVESRLSLEAIADRVGYESSASLSRAFRKVTGTSPGAFRRRSRQNGPQDSAV